MHMGSGMGSGMAMDMGISEEQQQYLDQLMRLTPAQLEKLPIQNQQQIMQLKMMTNLVYQQQGRV